jgi:hypothetical protein
MVSISGGVGRFVPLVMVLEKGDATVFGTVERLSDNNLCV